MTVLHCTGCQQPAVHVVRIVTQAADEYGSRFSHGEQRYLCEGCYRALFPIRAAMIPDRYLTARNDDDDELPFAVQKEGDR